MNWNWLQRPDLIILFAVLGLSFFQWLFRKLREQSEINRRKRALQVQRDEAMRRGQIVDRRTPQPPQPAQRSQPTPATSVSTDVQARQERLRELRRQQLEQLRQRQQAQRSAAAKQSPPSRHPARTAPTSRQQSARPPSAPSRRKAPAPTDHLQAEREKLRRASAQRQRAEEEARRARAAAEEQRERLERALRESAAEPPARFEPPAFNITLPPIGDIDGWRRAIVLSEVLSPPLALRPSVPDTF